MLEDRLLEDLVHVQLVRGEGRGVSSWYGRRDVACPVSTGGKGGGLQTCASCVPPASRPLRLRRALAAQRLRCRRAGARLRIGYPARGRYGGPGRLHAVATRARIGPRSWLVFTHRVLALQHLWPSPRSVNPPRPALCASATLRFKRQLVPAVLRSRSRPPPLPSY